MTAPFLLLCIFVLIGAGCASSSREAPRWMEMDSERLPPAFSAMGDESKTDSLVPAPEAWWSRLEDEALSSLMAMQEQHHPLLLAARARVREATAQVAAARAAQTTAITGGFSGLREQTSGNTGSNDDRTKTRNRFEAPIAVSKPLDLRDQLSARLEAQQALLLAAHADAQSLLIDLQRRLATSWFRLRGLHDEAEVLSYAVLIRERTHALTKLRFEQGDVSEIDVALADTEHSEARAEFIAVKRAMDLLRNEISTLAAQWPGADFPHTAGLPAPPPDGLLPPSPRLMLEQRADIVAATQRMLANDAETRAILAGRYPDLRIFGSAGLASESLDDFAEEDSIFWRAGLSFEGPLWDGGRIHAATEISDARRDIGLADWGHAVRQAYREVEDELTNLRSLEKQYTATSQTVKAAERSSDLTMRQYDAGLVDFFEVANVQRVLLRNQQALARIRAAQYEAAVRLALAFGVAWKE